MSFLTTNRFQISALRVEWNAETMMEKKRGKKREREMKKEIPSFLRSESRQ